jgi:hypothetical protein
VGALIGTRLPDVLHAVYKAALLSFELQFTFRVDRYGMAVEIFNYETARDLVTDESVSTPVRAFRFAATDGTARMFARARVNLIDPRALEAVLVVFLQARFVAILP